MLVENIQYRTTFSDCSRYRPKVPRNAAIKRSFSNMIDRNRFQYLKSYIEDCANNNIFPGAAFGIVTKKEGLFDAVGNSQLLPLKERASLDTVYDLASLSKVVATTTIILKLIEDGKITLYTKVSDILPDFKHKDVTLYNLLTHTSGLPADISHKDCSNRKDIIDKIYSMELEYCTGEKVVYSDIGFMLLGLIIEEVAGSIKEYFYENIAGPLNMISTCYNPKEEIKPICAATEYDESRGYIKGTVHDEKAFVIGGISGHAGLFSTAVDLGNFCSMMLNSGAFNGMRILSKNSIKILKECHTNGLNEKRGLGWQLRDNGNATPDLASDDCIFHTGFTGTSILIDFKNEFAFILLTNRVHPSRENIALIKLRRNINNIAETVVI
jgi:CubicO group peptidase (beta-lactamase class C family)